ncbi:MAG: hypothetical protein H6512_00275 [Acidimicrobiia bacterium]|nr:hypothetical protein [Acidimicrobiia bacterium]
MPEPAGGDDDQRPLGRGRRAALVVVEGAEGFQIYLGHTRWTFRESSHIADDRSVG